MSISFSDDQIDITPYLEPDEQNRIQWAHQFSAKVLDEFFGEKAESGDTLPWSATHTSFRLRQGETTVWAGAGGSGKSIITGMIAAHLMTQGRKILIASFEMLPEATLARMIRQTAGSSTPSLPFVLDFQKWAKDKLAIYDRHGSIDAETLLGVCRYAVAELGVNHIVIDSLMKISGVGVTDNYGKQNDFMNEITALARDARIHVHLIAHARKSQRSSDELDLFSIKGSGSITDNVDNVVLVSRNHWKEAQKGRHDYEPNDDVENSIDTILKVAKQRHHTFEGKFGLYFNHSTLQFSKIRGRRMPFDIPKSERA